ncbi:superoxide dismutase [Methylacidiphilum sp. Yel]|jgi:Fe-Mn family superoxide dismutase|uniref:Fe-Mn family superoxide dismutase n=1 Tax=Methylacidiphilum sp. Yel TaxID=1847730 RepID=UPI00106B38F1|nr:Fe-Mn family superoxide dismutase [Methylacidiphilum sp. Yel]TFE70916.1 superoxide dismutase [Methylacidiphilum sp. Yel]
MATDSLKVLTDKSEIFLKKFENGIGKFSANALNKHVALYSHLLQEANSIANEFSQYLDNWPSFQNTEEEPSKKELVTSKIGQWFSLYGKIASHELYFSSLGRNGNCEGKIKELLEINFDSVVRFKLDFKIKALYSTGWVWLVLDHYTGKLFNLSSNREDAFPFSGMSPLLAIDLVEHAYESDFGSDKEGYIEEFFNALDWKEIEKNLPIM